MLDLIYTAFLVPILVGFEISDVDFGWGCLVNLIAGVHPLTIPSAYLTLQLHCCRVASMLSIPEYAVLHASAAS